MQGVLDRIEVDRDNLDMKNKADLILEMMDVNKRKKEMSQRAIIVRLERIEKRQNSILAISVGGAILSLILTILLAVILTAK